MDARASDLPSPDDELVFVRRVTYGRRLVLAISSSVTQEELAYAVRFRADGPGIAFDADAKARLLEIASKLEVSATVVGGEADAALGRLNAAVVGDPGGLPEALADFLAATSEKFPLAGATPLAFELEYAADAIPFAAYETRNFGGKFEVYRVDARGEASIDVDIALTNPSCLHDRDCEIGSDDWTRADVSTKLAHSGNMLTLEVGYTVLEGSDKKRPNDSVLRVNRLFTFDMARPIEKVVTLANDRKTKWYPGVLSGTMSFPVNVGPLRDIKIVLDGKGDHDEKRVRLNARAHIEVVLEREPAP